ncbi:carboxymuconolactone decarboxylase family protein [Acinetobacter beijerinckii]|uniref:carboxymuconolactone decarboxylase family protein n=1 Tax=Acinetobacter beijerinckii TaxID=262668 RepID=UPI003AF5A046
MNSPYLKNLGPINYDSAEGQQKQLLENALNQVGFIPNMYANMVNVPAILSTYLHGYDAFRSKSGFSPVEQEIIFLAISQVNGCNYCTAAHSMLADKVSGVPKDILKSIRTNQPIQDKKLKALFELTQDIVTHYGQPSSDNVKTFFDMGYTELQLLNIILAASVKVLSNYTNHAFATEIDTQFFKYRID